VPVGVAGRDVACGVEFGDLFRGEVPAEGTEIVAQLLFHASADDDVSDRRALEEPVQGDLMNGLSGFFGDSIEGVGHFVEMLVRNVRPEIPRWMKKLG
jgi:hypothetical protein